MPWRVSITSARAAVACSTSARSSVGLGVGAATSGADPVRSSLLVSVSGADSPSGTAPLIGSLGVRFGAQPFVVGHRSRPFSSCTAGLSSCACSASWLASTALMPIGVCRTLSRSLNMASINISGRGGQPGRYMSTGTT